MEWSGWLNYPSRKQNSGWGGGIVDDIPEGLHQTAPNVVLKGSSTV